MLFQRRCLSPNIELVKMRKPAQKLEKSSSNIVFLGVAGILLITAVTYIPAVQNGFVWDDNVFVIESPIGEFLQMRFIVIGLQRNLLTITPWFTHFFGLNIEFGAKIQYRIML